MLPFTDERKHVEIMYVLLAPVVLVARLLYKIWACIQLDDV